MSKRDPEKTRRAGNKSYAKHGHKVRAKNKNVTRYAKYGLSKGDAVAALLRQRNACMTCRTIITLSTGVIDHCHETDKVRGWLCRKCNMVLGLVGEDKLTLRRLSTYLDYDRTKVNVYLMGSLRNPKIREIAERLRAEDMDVYDDWHAAGEHADDEWQAYVTHRKQSYDQALRGRSAENVYFWDRAMIDMCDYGVMVMPCGKSAHLEAGYMRACGKPVFMLMEDEPERFDVMPQFFTRVVRSVDELLKVLV